MSTGKSSIARRGDLKSAAQRFKKGETISLEDLARLWGVSKARFINVRSDITDFPDPVGKQGNALLYNAKPVLETLLRHESRNDQLTAAKSSKVARILGAAKGEEQEALLPASEMLSLARLGAETDKRRREQGELVRFTDVQETAGQLFGYLSNVLSTLSDSVDPNGRLPGPVRATMDGLGKDLLLRIYGELTDMLAGDANVPANPTKTVRTRPNRTRRTKVRAARA